MKKRTAESITSIGIFILFLGVFLYLSPLKITRTDNYEILAQRGFSITSYYEEGERIEGYFTVRSGNEEITFNIKDPYGVSVHDAGIVKSRHDFGLTTEHSGVYTLFFGNTDDYGKIVYLSYEVILSTVLDFVMVAIGGCFVLIGSNSIIQERLKRKQAQESLQQTD